MADVQIIPTKFLSEGEVLRGSFVVPKGKGRFPGICKFHGLPGSPDQVHGIASRLALAGFAVLTFDFRGFRQSEGLFSLADEVHDAQIAVTHLLDSEYTIDDWAGVFGASYGGAVAVLAGVRDRRIQAVCLRAPVFDTLAFAQGSLIQPAVWELLRSAPNQMHGLTDPQLRKEILEGMISDARVFNPIKEIAKMAPRPLFVITGSADAGIPLDGVVQLFELAPEPKELVVVEGADHNLTNPEHFETTVKWVVDWFKQIRRID